MADPGWGIWEKCPPNPLLLVEEPAILLIKILNVMSGQNQLSYKARENMHILPALIHLKPKQTNVKLAVKLLPSTFVHTKRLLK